MLYGMLYVISLLPLPILYLFSDGLTYIFFYVIGYRKDVVMSNLKIAFPEKTEIERKNIAKKFYRNFIDTFVESIKLITADDKLIDKMFTGSTSIFDTLAASKKNIQIHAMHNFNWEIVNQGISRMMPLPFLAVYQPILNSFFEKLFYRIRSRYGTILIPANDFKNNYIKHGDSQYIIALVADQNPGNPARAWWANFFGKPAPFVKGPEKASRERDNIVLFGNFFRIKRGLYTIEVEIATDDPSTLPEGELTLRYIKYVEDRIRERPDNYLWSHRRWKHKYKDEYADDVLQKLNLQG
jgi:KDO2-lipid IV(A) lauroyltransferase